MEGKRPMSYIEWEKREEKNRLKSWESGKEGEIN
jgi:hypothetical protein